MNNSASHCIGHEPRARQAESKSAPLTLQQELALKHWMQEGIPWAIELKARLRGPLDIQNLQKSLAEVTKRHDSLRTRILVVGNDLRQVVDDESRQYPINIVQCSGVSETDIENDARNHLQPFFVKPIDLAEGPLFRALLLKLAKHEHILAIAIHHIVSDSISATLFLREVWRLYGDLTRGQPSSLSKVRLQYPAYAVWQRHERQRSLALHSIYWKTALAGAAPVQLPIDDNLRSLETLSSAIQAVIFDEMQSSALHELARRERTSLAICILTLYSALLSHWSGQRDFVVPFNVSGRFSSEHANVLGLLGHHLPIRITTMGTETFVDLLHLVRQRFLTACEHPDFGKSLGDLPEMFKSTSFNWITSDHGLVTPAAWDGRSDCPTVDAFPADTGLWPPSRLPCDTFFFSGGTKRGIYASMWYRKDRFAQHTMERFCNEFRMLAEDIVRDPLVRVSTWSRNP